METQMYGRQGQRMKKSKWVRDFEQSNEKLVVKFIQANKIRYLFGLIVFAGVNALEILTPRLTGQIIDQLYERLPDLNLIKKLCIAIFGISIAVMVLQFFGRLLVLGAGILFDVLMRKKLFRKLLTLSMSFFYKKSIGDIMALSINDLSAINNAIGRGAMIMCNMIILAIASIIAMGESMSYRLTLMIFIPLPLLVFTMFKFGTVINRKSRKVQDRFGQLSGKVQENISGIRVVKSFVREETEQKAFEEVNQAHYNAEVELAFVQGLFMPLISFISSSCYLILIYFGGRSVILDRTISIGDFVAATSYISMLIRPMQMLGRLLSMVQRGKASLGRIYDLFNEKPDIYDNKFNQNKVEIKDNRLEGKIEFKNLTFAYNEENGDVLKNIDLTINPGETVAFIGPVGSGKSTVSNLLIRLFDTKERGQLLIDGMDIADIPLKTLRANIGYIPQDNFLFSDTIRYNIAFTPEDLKDEEVEEAAKASDIYDTIMNLPDKWETLLGEKGVNLSGGQKQRLCIARAIAKNAPIMIFDDCLSAVDMETESRILKSLKDVQSNRTCIIIAHRISTVKNADKIVVLNKGRIVEMGNHEELLEKRGYYYKAYSIQLLEQQYGAGLRNKEGVRA